MPDTYLVYGKGWIDVLSMADGPVSNLPAGQDAYAGYVDASGIGVTFPAVVAAFPAALHLSISAHGAAAECGDVENGALRSWAGFQVGYCNLANVGTNIRAAGRPLKLWVAHYTDSPHICTQAVCDPDLRLTSLAGWTADGTQWTTHGNVWDQSLLAADFFDFQGDYVPLTVADAELVANAVSQQLDLALRTGGQWMHDLTVQCVLEALNETIPAITSAVVAKLPAGTVDTAALAKAVVAELAASIKPA